MEYLSAEGFKAGMEGPFWQEILGEIESWIPDLQIMLEDPNGDYTEQQYQQARGSLRALRNITGMAEVMLETKELATKSEETDNG